MKCKSCNKNDAFLCSKCIEHGIIEYKESKIKLEKQCVELTEKCVVLEKENINLTLEHKEDQSQVQYIRDALRKIKSKVEVYENKLKK